MIAKLAQKHNLSEDAVRHLAQAMQQGNGTQAQFNHPELGGMGQWQNGMTMIGDAFNASLKARVTAVCNDLAQVYRETPSALPTMPTMQAMTQSRWWSETLGEPSSVGSQNDISYAIFPQKGRLQLRRASNITTYDTGAHRITGVSQAQNNQTVSLIFTAQDGTRLTIHDFTVID